MAQTIENILKEYWGYESFRPQQEDIIRHLLSGKDTMAILPTGGGKSICFQVPAMAAPGICIVVSPLIALIKDQVGQLERRGIPTLSMHAGMPFKDLERTLNNAIHGNYKFLYVSPERLQTDLFLEYLPALPINFIAIDEAHCISQWGYDFRPAYMNIAKLREEKPLVPIIALSASATAEVQQDIAEKLALNNDLKSFKQSFLRANLSYSIFDEAVKPYKLLQIANGVKGSGIVYCSTRKQTQEIAALLQQNNISAHFYHAGLDKEQRSARQDDWINNKIRIMACTNAFGMGIDKPDVRLVVHYNLPDCLENYYQEAGRAGRDGKRAYAVMLSSNKDKIRLENNAQLRYPEVNTIKEYYFKLMDFIGVPAGIGEGSWYDFDITTFCQNFQLDILQATFVLNLLEQECILIYNIDNNKPSTITFTSTREALHDLEQYDTDLDYTAKSLLRCYEGIFNFECMIREGQLAKFANRPIDFIHKHLLKLHQLGIINYQQTSTSPQLYLVLNRMHRDSFLLNYERINVRKNNYTNRLHFFLEYVSLKTCRSISIGSYFNKEALPNCGICDNCIRQKQEELSSLEFQKIYDSIKRSNIHLNIHTITNAFPQFNAKKILITIDYLLKDEIVRVDELGNISFS